MILWRSLLLVYPEIDVQVTGKFGLPKRFLHRLPAQEIKDAIDSFQCFPGLVSELTDNQAGIEYDIVTSERALSTLTVYQDGLWWPSPTDTEPEMEPCLQKASYDSVFIFWPQNNLQKGESIESGGWGLGMGPSPWSLGKTYATVANAHPFAWRIPIPGEVWLHEWLHGVCAYFAEQDCPMPDGDADGAERHGYERSPQTGWMSYYRDLMNGNVMEDGKPTGIPAEAWREPFVYSFLPT